MAKSYYDSYKTVLDQCDRARLNPLWTGQPWTCSTTAMGMSVVFSLVLVAYMLYNGQSYRRRKILEQQLVVALKTVSDMEEKLLSLEANDVGSLKRTGKEIRIWMDGAFDMMHFGHMNAFRQARALGTYLIAGVNSSETITAAKGAPVNNDYERSTTVGGCKWVDEVVPGVPYVMNDDYVKWIIEHYNIDYIVHGDDPCIVDGKDVYESAKKMGKYLTIPRTEGISTTDIVGRMLLHSKEHHSSPPRLTDRSSSDNLAVLLASSNGVASMPYLRKSSFLATSRILRLFGAGVKQPKSGDCVVYLAGGWDMFHAGHIATLEKARKLGDYVIVGVHNDYDVNLRRGLNYPIMSLHERVLSVLGCKWVDDVLIDAPYVVTSDMIASLRINVVVVGTVHDSPSPSPRVNEANAARADPSPQKGCDEDPYAVPRQLGILQVVQSEHETMCSRDIVGRICQQADHFNRKFEKKKKAEVEYYDVRYGRVASASAN